MTSPLAAHCRMAFAYERCPSNSASTDIIKGFRSLLWNAPPLPEMLQAALLG